MGKKSKVKFDKQKSLTISGKALKVEDIGFEPMTPCVQGSTIIITYNYLYLYFITKHLIYNILMTYMLTHSMPSLIIILTPILTPYKTYYNVEL